MCHFREFDSARWEELDEPEDQSEEPAEAMDLPEMEHEEIEPPEIAESELADD